MREHQRAPVAERCCWCSAAARFCTSAPAGSDAQPINHHQHLKPPPPLPRPVAPRQQERLDPALVEVLPEWLCGIASSAPLQTWSLHGDSSREKETASVGEGGGTSVLLAAEGELQSCLRWSSPEGSPVRKGLTAAPGRLLDDGGTCLQRR